MTQTSTLQPSDLQTALDTAASRDLRTLLDAATARALTLHREMEGVRGGAIVVRRERGVITDIVHTTAAIPANAVPGVSQPVFPRDGVHAYTYLVIVDAPADADDEWLDEPERLDPGAVLTELARAVHAVHAPQEPSVTVAWNPHARWGERESYSDVQDAPPHIRSRLINVTWHPGAPHPRERTIASARIIPAAARPAHSQALVLGTFTGEDAERPVLEYYDDELRFTAADFVGLTQGGARALFHRRDVAYLRS